MNRLRPLLLVPVVAFAAATVVSVAKVAAPQEQPTGRSLVKVVDDTYAVQSPVEYYERSGPVRQAHRSKKDFSEAVTDCLHDDSPFGKGHGLTTVTPLAGGWGTDFHSRNGVVYHDRWRFVEGRWRIVSGDLSVGPGQCPATLKPRRVAPAEPVAAKVVGKPLGAAPATPAPARPQDTPFGKDGVLRDGSRAAVVDLRRFDTTSLGNPRTQNQVLFEVSFTNGIDAAPYNLYGLAFEVTYGDGDQYGSVYTDDQRYPTDLQPGRTFIIRSLPTDIPAGYHGKVYLTVHKRTAKGDLEQRFVVVV